MKKRQTKKSSKASVKDYVSQQQMDNQSLEALEDLEEPAQLSSRDAQYKSSPAQRRQEVRTALP